MLPLSYGAIYKTPDDHKPPEETDLSDDTEYPNLNSRDYAKRPLNHTMRMHEAWECISISTPISESQGNVAISCNKLSGREWTSSFWGFEKSEVVKNKHAAIEPNSACFKLLCPAIINCMEFVAPNTLLVAYNNGGLQVWSTHSEVRSPHNPYCLFLIGDKCEHMKPITCLTSFKVNPNKAVTGCQDGTIKVWDMGSADLVSIQSYRFAHTDSVTGLSSSPHNENMFVTSSLDKSCILWDDRETRPAIALYQNHSVRLKNVKWSVKENNQIYLGDESGFILTLDSRNPKELLNKTQYFDRPIRKILPLGDIMAVIADTNVIKVSSCSNNSVIFEDCSSDNFIRDGAWLSSTELLTVGFEGKLQCHILKGL